MQNYWNKEISDSGAFALPLSSCGQNFNLLMRGLNLDLRGVPPCLPLPSPVDGLGLVVQLQLSLRDSLWNGAWPLVCINLNFNWKVCRMQRAIRTTSTSTLRRLWRQFLWRAAQWHVGAIAKTHIYIQTYLSLRYRLCCHHRFDGQFRLQSSNSRFHFAF